MDLFATHVKVHGSHLHTPAQILFFFVFLQLQDSVTMVNPGVSQLCIRGDGKLLASAGWDHRVRIFGWKKLRPLAVLQYHTDMVQSVAFSDHQDPKQRLLAAGSKDQRISLWSIYNEGADTGWASELWEDIWLINYWLSSVLMLVANNSAIVQSSGYIYDFIFCFAVSWSLDGIENSMRVWGNPWGLYITLSNVFSRFSY